MRSGVAGLHAALGYRGMSGAIIKKAGGGSPPVNLTSPLLDNANPGVGETLYGTNGTWTGATSFTYQWIDVGLGTPIPGATNINYLVDISESGSVIVLQVTAHGTGGAAQALSAEVGVSPTPVCQSKLYGFNIPGSLGSLVSSWPDFSGNSNSPVQAVMAAQPMLASGINSNQVIQTDGVSTFMQYPAAFTVGTYFLVVHPYGTQAFGSMLGGNGAIHVLVRNGTGNDMYFDSTSIFGVSRTTRVNDVVSSTLGTTPIIVEMDGTPMSVQFILGDDVFGGTFASGYIAAFLAFSTQLSTGDITSTANFLKAFYGL